MKFKSKYDFLSNFYPSRVRYNGKLFPTVEHAYQYAKMHDPVFKKLIQEASTPGQAKRLGKRGPIVAGWDNKKIPIMLTLLKAKFKDEALKKKLLATGLIKLEEGNTWHDNFWGNCECENCKIKPGENMLGTLLMQVRDELRRKDGQ